MACAACVTNPCPAIPGVERDFSFVFDDGVAFEKITGAVNELGISELRQLVTVEIFRGGNVPAGKYSLLLRMQFQSSERTLREDEVAWLVHQDHRCPAKAWAAS